MSKATVQTLTLKGSHYEIGKQLAETLDDSIGLAESPISDELLEESLKIFDEFCPGLTDELKGFSDGKGVTLNHLEFPEFSYLKPNCSEIAISSRLAPDGHTRIARNYEFEPAYEDMRVHRVSPEGKYRYISGALVLFGCSEGVNEHGLCISMTSCGMPVSVLPDARKPEVKGLQFWCIIRTLLERCKSVDEAKLLFEEIPISYNINLLIADASDNIVLFETLNGVKASTSIQSSESKYIAATNHPILSPFKEMEPYAMSNSVKRLELLEALGNQQLVNVNDIKTLLTTHYPNGLTCHYYKEFFGTIKSIILDANDKSFEICWGGNEKNGWVCYNFSTPWKERVMTDCIELNSKTPSADFFEVETL